MQIKMHIKVTGEPASGKTKLIKHIAWNPPEGYKLADCSLLAESVHREEWTLVFDKII